MWFGLTLYDSLFSLPFYISCLGNFIVGCFKVLSNNKLTVHIYSKSLSSNLSTSAWETSNSEKIYNWEYKKIYIDWGI